MEKVLESNKCTGCSACSNSCPKQCISMQENKEGFLEPIIDQKLCIDCNICKNTCPVLKNLNAKKVPTSYLAINKNEKERISSSSGGIFILLANYVLENKGYVCGAGYDKDKKVVHKLINNKKDLPDLKKSKYVQSDTTKVYSKIKEVLEKEKLVLYVSTPCQVAGLLAYLKKPYKNLYTCDLVCHGVPSPKVYSKYLKFLETKYNDKLDDIDFRSKDTGWKDFSLKFSFKNGNNYAEKFNKETYMNGFLQNLFLRNSCYQCSFKKGKHIADITLGDYWGMDKTLKKYDDDKGTSLLLINSDNGEKLLSKIEKDIILKEVNYDKAKLGNICIEESVPLNKNRDNFFADLDKEDIDTLIKRNLTKDNVIIKLLKVVYRKVLGR